MKKGIYIKKQITSWIALSIRAQGDKPIPRKLKTRRLVARGATQGLLWDCFDHRRTRKNGGSAAILLHNHVSLSMPRGSSHREQVEQIARAATQPFPIVSIAKSLDEFKSIRGRTFSRDAGCEIDLIVGNYPSMRWWMGKGGLVIEVVPDGANRLSAFDRRAGKLVCDRRRNGRLSKDAVREIAAELDAEGFVLLENLQPAKRRAIAVHNQRFAKSAIKTFTAAVAKPIFVRFVRLRLCSAHNSYQKACGPNPS